MHRFSPSTRVGHLLLQGVFALLAAVPGQAQSIGLKLGDSLQTQVEPGGKLVVALTVDLSAAGSAGLAALQGSLSWPREILTLDSVRAVPGTGLTLTANTSGAASAGVVRLNLFGTQVLAASGPVVRFHFTAGGETSGTRISFDPEAAGNATGQSVLSLVRVRPLEACVARRVPWGDASDDGVLNIIDAQQLARYSLGMSVTSAEAIGQRGDVTDNGTIDVIDAQQVARWSIGLPAVPRLGATTLAVPPAEGLQVPVNTSVVVGGTMLITATPTDANGKLLTGCSPVAWTSSNPAIATVDQDGLVTGVAQGTSGISVVVGGRQSGTAVSVRALADPATLSALAEGLVRRWALTRQDYDTGLLLNTMADHYTVAFNNFNLRYYSSYGNECPQRCGWANSPSSAFYAEVEVPWYGYYALLLDANDILGQVRGRGVLIGTLANTRMIETLAAMMQGVALGAIALTYDQGFVLDENSVRLATPSLPFRTRAELREAAVAKLEAAYQLATANAFITPAAWFGAVNGRSYTNTQLAKLIRTLQAELLAQYPRNAAENAQVNWGQVASYAAQGLSSAGGTDITFYQDRSTWVDGVKDWSNDIGTVRVDTRLATIITDGPTSAKVHVTPWPATGNPIPDAYDKRVGDGSWGPTDNFGSQGTYAATARAGTDFAFASSNPFSMARGTYHQSQLGHIRYSYLAYPGFGLPGENGRGQAPFYTQPYNDLLLAEGLIRSGGSKTTAAGLINKTRVTRGGLSSLTGGESDAVLLRALQYEQAIELLGFGGVPFYNLRRVTPAGHQGLNNSGCPALLCLWPQTPRHLPVPAKELILLTQELYSYGGSGNPEAVAPVGAAPRSRIRGVREIADELMARSLAAARARRFQ